jgi:hypothetical protein
MNKIAFFQKREIPVWAAEAAAGLGLLVYFIQALFFAHNTISNLDEGAYLLKGLLFATGEYRPFAPGISTMKAPLAFLIPGYVQLAFGAGVRTGRYLALFFGVMAVLGVWVAARRLGGKWLAAGAVWVFASSPMIIKFYSGSTQSTVACLLAWTLVFTLGEKRAFWQLALGGFLAGLLLLVRQNMLPVLPLLAVYAFWQHGKKAFGLLICGAAIVAWVHFIYWPDILQLWYWVPLAKIPAQVVYSGGGSPVWTPTINLDTRLISIFQAFRFHFIALVGTVIAFLLAPKLIGGWKSRADFRTSLFLFALFLGLLYMHSIAAIGNDYCVFCFSPYIAFFNVAAILLIVVSVKSWNWRPHVLIQILLLGAFLVAAAGMGFSAFENIGSALLQLPAPRVRDFRILAGFTTWKNILANGLRLNYTESMRYASAAFGLILGVLTMLVGYIIWRRAARNSANFGAFFAGAILIAGVVFSPALHGNVKDCASDVILANEQIGAHLRDVIPAGSLVYWDGGLSAAPLLYLPGVKIFPAQINSAYTFLSHGETKQLEKFGMWNEEIDAQWKATADFFIIEEKRYLAWKEFLNPDQFDEFRRSPVGASCAKESGVRIFRRK